MQQDISVFEITQPVFIGSDHAGFEFKTELKKFLEATGFSVTDVGAYDTSSVDYPDYAHPVAEAVEQGRASFGVLICGSANGVCITANKHQGVRAALCWQPEIAQLARQHNNANVVCIPARFIDLKTAKDIVGIFAETPFEGGRHSNRVQKISCM
jgi:ribose 5-phosphate isomerase B